MKDEFIKALKSGRFIGWVNELNYSDLKQAADIIVEQHAAGLIDLIGELNSLDSSTLERSQLQQWSIIFHDAKPQIDIDATQIFDLTSELIESFDRPYDYHLRAGFEGWLENNQTLAPKIFKLIMERAQESELMYICLKAWREIDVPSAYSAILSTLNSEFRNIKHSALNALSLFELSALENGDEAITALARIAQGDSDEDAVRAVSTITHLLEKSDQAIPELVKALVAVCENPKPDMNRELISGWSMRPSAFPDQAEESVIELMATLPNDVVGNTQFLDSILCQFDFDKDRNIAMTILSRLLTHEYSPHVLKQMESVKYALSELPKEIKSWYVITWFLTGDHRLGEAASELYSSLSEDLIEFSLDGFDLSEAEIFYLTKKVFAYLFYSNGAAVSILAGFLSVTKNNAQTELATFIGNFWLRNYPSDIDSFVELAKKEQTLKKPVRAMKKTVKAYLEGTDQNDVNLALKPSENEWRIQSEIKYKKDKEMRSDIHRNSIFGSVMSVSPVLYGSSMISYIHPANDGIPVRQEIPMQTHSMSGPYPRMLRLCPEWLNYLLFQFRIAERP